MKFLFLFSLLFVLSLCDEYQESICAEFDSSYESCENAPGCAVPAGGEGCEAVVDIVVGDTCYCNSTTNATVTRRVRRLGSKGSKTSTVGDSGAGVGDCDCDKDYGMQEMRIMYLGDVDGVDIQYTTKNDDSICGFTNVNYGDEITCNLDLTRFTDSNGDDILKYTTDTYFTVDGGSELCDGKIHTSCSSDIVGTYGTSTNGNDNCEKLFVTGWKDGNPNDDNDCDDGEDECDCDDGDTFLMPCEGGCEEDPETDDTIIRERVCYCSNLNVTTESPFTTEAESTARPQRRRLGKSGSGSKKSKGSKDETGGGYGDCECDGGMTMLRFVYIGTASDADSLKVFYGALDGAVICEFEDVAPGDEVECAITDQVDNDGDPIEKFSKDTYLSITYADTSMDDCEGSFHTSCSRDIVGYTAEGCDELIVTAWADNDSDDRECDDGYDPCDCPDDVCAVNDGDTDACTSEDGCCYVSNVDQCHTCNYANQFALFVPAIVVALFSLLL